MGCDIHMWLISRDEETGDYTNEVLFCVSNGYGGFESMEFPYFRNYDTFGTLARGVRSEGPIPELSREIFGRFPKERIPWIDSYRDFSVKERFTLKDYDSNELHSVQDRFTLKDYYESNDLHSHTFITMKNLKALIKQIKDAISAITITSENQDLRFEMTNVYKILKMVYNYAKCALKMEEFKRKQNFDEGHVDKDYSVILIAFDN